MENSLHYIELSKNPIRFDSVSQLTTVFFDDSNKQVFAVRSGGATGVVVKGPTEDDIITFCMDDKGTITSIKFSPDNRILAIQRKENSVEFICFKNNQPQSNNIIIYNAKSSTIFGFVWVHNKEVAMIANSGIEIFTINTDKKQIKSIKSITLSVKWFSWCAVGNLALIACEGNVLYPVIIKQKALTKLSKLEIDSSREVPEREVTLGYLNGTLAVLILQQSNNRLLEVLVYLLNGPGLAPKKSHVLRLGHSGRFAMNIVDNLIVVHHQASCTSLIFDIALNDEIHNDIVYHSPITPGRTIRPFSLKIPSISPDGQTMNCDLYSVNWVLFQPNIVIDANLGCMWYLSLELDSFCSLIIDRVRLVEFLLQRTNGKPYLIKVLQKLMKEPNPGTLLPILENIFDRLNKVYQIWIQIELQNQTAISSSQKNISKSTAPPKVFIDQSEMYGHVFSDMVDKPHADKVIILYLQSLNKYNISPQEDLSKMLAAELIKNKKFLTLQKLVDYSLLLESKPIACFLLAQSNVCPSISQTALDMLHKINANEIIIEVLLGQGRIVEALKLAKSLPNSELISARKYLEAAMKTKDVLIFYAVYKHFQQRNLRMRGNSDFLNGEKCSEYIQHYAKLFNSAN